MFNLSKETKIGLMAIVAIALGFWGYKFLKGTNVLTSSQIFYVKYKNVDQLRPSSPIFISGLQVGMVKDLYVDPEDGKTIIAVLNIESDINIPKNATASIIGLTLMGGKAIEIQIPQPCKGDDCAESYTYLQGSTKSLAESLLGNPQELDAYTQRLKMAFDTLVNPNDPEGLGPSVKALQASLINIAEVTSKLNRMMSENAKGIAATSSNAASITSNLKQSNEKITQALDNLAQLSQQLKDAGLDKTAKGAIDSVVLSVNALRQTLTAAQVTVQRVDTLAQRLANGEGSAGKLLTDAELYQSIAQTTRQLALLEQDLRLNPQRYTNFRLRLFGKQKVSRYTEPLDDPAYRSWMDSVDRARQTPIKR